MQRFFNCYCRHYEECSYTFKSLVALFVRPRLMLKCQQNNMNSCSMFAQSVATAQNITASHARKTCKINFFSGHCVLMSFIRHVVDQKNKSTATRIYTVACSSHFEIILLAYLTGKPLKLLSPTFGFWWKANLENIPYSQIKHLYPLLRWILIFDN